MLKPQAALEKMNPDDTNIHALSILDRYENCPDYLNDFFSWFCISYKSKTAWEYKKAWTLLIYWLWGIRKL